MNALHLMVDTGNPNAIDLSLKNSALRSLSIGPLRVGEASKEVETVCAALCQHVRVRNRIRLQKKGRIRLISGFLLTLSVCPTKAGPTPATVLSVRSTS